MGIRRAGHPVTARIVVERRPEFEAMRWTPDTDMANVGRMLAWLEIRVRFGSHLGEGTGSRSVLVIEALGRDLWVEPGSWVVFDPRASTVRILSDERYRATYEEIEQ